MVRRTKSVTQCALACDLRVTLSVQISFFQRPPSAQWEPLPILRIPGLSLWVWFRPQQLPSGLMVMVPPELSAAYPGGLPITLADLLQSAGVSAEHLQSVSIFGGEWQPPAMIVPYLAHPLPPLIPGARAEIMIGVVEVPRTAPSQVPQPLPAQAPIGEMTGAAEVDKQPDVTDEASMYERVESSWRSSIQMERQMTGLRQKLSSLLNTMGKYDRDLHPNERLAADREDRDAWHDARRWLRDLSAKCHREVKAFDIGMTSAAGKRNWMEETFETIIKPRVPTSDLETIRREFETYRKDMVNLQKAMQAAAQAAAQNGTQRAQRVLGVINRKIKERRAKMREPLGGTNMDRSVRRKS